MTTHDDEPEELEDDDEGLLGPEEDEGMDDAPIFGRRTGPIDMRPIPFTILGYRKDDGSEVAYHFHAEARIPAGVGLDMATQINENGMIPMPAINAFFQAALVPDDLDDWMEMLYDDQVIVETDALGEMFRWLNRKYGSGRPTRRSSGSVSGRGTTQGPSRAARRSQGARSERSTSRRR